MRDPCQTVEQRVPGRRLRRYGSAQPNHQTKQHQRQDDDPAAHMGAQALDLPRNVIGYVHQNLRPDREIGNDQHGEPPMDCDEQRVIARDRQRAHGIFPWDLSLGFFLEIFP